MVIYHCCCHPRTQEESSQTQIRRIPRGAFTDMLINRRQQPPAPVIYTFHCHWKAPILEQLLQPFLYQWYGRTERKGWRVNPCEMIYHCNHVQYSFCHSCPSLPSNEPGNIIPRNIIPRNIQVWNWSSPEAIPQIWAAPCTGHTHWLSPSHHISLCSQRGKKRKKGEGGEG